jgi:hypothetical protein
MDFAVPYGKLLNGSSAILSVPLTQGLGPDYKEEAANFLTEVLERADCDDLNHLFSSSALVLDPTHLY